MKAQVFPEETWATLHQEYVTTDNGYRSLAKMYGIPYNQVRNRAVAEGWSAQRKKFIEDRVQQEIEAAHKFANDENSRTMRIASKLLDKIEASVESLLPEDRDGIKKLTSAIMDLKNIGIFRADLDREEQMARIAKLRKDAENEVVDKNIVITFEEGFDEYAN